MGLPIEGFKTIHSEERFTVQVGNWRPNHSYTGGKSEGCSKVSSQTHWAIPRGPQQSRFPFVEMERSVTASPNLRALVRPPTVGPMRCINPGGIRHGKEKSPTTRINGVQPAKACEPTIWTCEVVAHNRCERSENARICRLESRHDPRSLS